jgi:hypothetical protein
VLAAVVVGGLALLLWLSPVRNNNDQSEVFAIWTMRIASVIGLFAAVRWIAAGSQDVVRRKRLATLQPSHAVECPFCLVDLIPGSPWRCPNCGIVRL